MMSFSSTRPTTISPRATAIYLKGYTEPRDYRSKKEEKEGERVEGDNVRKRRSL